MTTSSPKIREATGQPYRPLYVSTAKAEAWWIEKARTSPYWFIWYVSGMKPAAHHVTWLEAMLSNDRVNIISAREAAKTTISVYFLAWLIGKNPLLTHFIGSVSAKQSQERLEMVREIIEHSTRFHNVFPNVFVDYKRSSTKNEFSVWSNKLPHTGELNYGNYRSIVMAVGDPKNPTLFATGAGSSQIIGRRLSGVCLVDDPHSEANSATEALRDKVHDWFLRTLLPCVKEGGKTVVISTRWAETDLSGRLKETLDLDGKPIWHTIEIPAFDEHGHSYWPEYWPAEKLDAKRQEIGLAMFEVMYNCNPLGLSSGQFTIDMLRNPIPPKELMPEFKSVIVSTDLAFTDDTYSDYCVFALIGRTGDRNYDMYVLDMYRGKHTIKDGVDQLGKFCDEMMEKYGRIDKVLFEKQAMTLASFNEAKEARPDLPLEWVPLKGDKPSRLSAVAFKAQRGGLHVNTDMKPYKAMCSELIAYPKVQNDDICDCLSLSCQYWGTHFSNVGVTKIQSPFLL